jgi:hypothetical protein
MKLLKVSDGEASYLGPDGTFVSVDRIAKEDLLRLVDLTLSEDVEFDSYDETAVKNQAQQIIYKSVVERLEELKERREEFTDESERLYLAEYERYSEELSGANAEG